MPSRAGKRCPIDGFGQAGTAIRQRRCIMRRQRFLLGKMLTLAFLPLVLACQDDKPSLTEIEFRPELVVVPVRLQVQPDDSTH